MSRVIIGLEELRGRCVKPVVTIGNFDGVHRGHQALLAMVLKRADAISGTSMAITFEPHPMRVLRPSVNLPMITPLPRKLELLKATGVDIVLCLRFDQDFALLSADDFVDKLLVGRFGVAEVVVGHDFTFGHKGLGDLELLAAKGRAAGFLVHQVGPIVVGKSPVSSTRVRQVVRAGDLREARKLLGRHYQISGQVERGHGRGGRLLGFPTANLGYGQQMLPAEGVYATMAKLDDSPNWMPGVTNIGLNPTFSDQALSVETHILDHESDLYGKNLALRFVERLRGEKRFASFEELKAAIAADTGQAREVLAPWLSGDKIPDRD